MIHPTFDHAINHARDRVIKSGHWVEGTHWQSVDVSSRPEMITLETTFFDFTVQIKSENLQRLALDIRPNLPWADDHFLERVSGEPLNPGEQWANWPWGNRADSFRDDEGQFSHSYMERYWPKYSGLNSDGRFETPMILDGVPIKILEFPSRWGIRYRYGDLNDVIDLLQREPLTRQAYLPIWFPEDTGVTHRERVPCTLGYHFLVRHGVIHQHYVIRSCDLVRHFQDDIYLSVRLQLWILDQLRKRDDKWKDIKPGLFKMSIGSLHLFKNDVRKFAPDGEWIRV